MVIEEHSNDSGLLKSGSIFLVGSAVVAISNYLYHLSMGRMLGPGEYGVLASLFALIYLALFSNNVFVLVVSKYAAEFHSDNKHCFLKRLIQKALKKVLAYGAVFLIIYILFTPYIARFMNIEGTKGLVIVGITVYLSLISTVVLGSLNGMQKFWWQNIVNSGSALLKLLLAVLFVYLGFGVNGALIAIALSVVVGIIIGIYPLSESLGNIEGKDFDAQRIYKYAMPVFFASLLSMMIITSDQVLVKHYFSADDSGNYAAAGVIAKAIWFVSAFMTPALFPKVVAGITQKKNTKVLLRKALAYTTLFAFFGTLAYWFLPGFIVRLLYGNNYAGVSGLIWIFGMSMGMFALSQILVAYNLAHERKRFIWILLLGFAVEVLGIVLYHKLLNDVVMVFFASNLMILFFMIAYNAREIFYAD